MFSYELYDDVTAEERKEIVALESAEIALDRAIMAYDVIMESQELQLREAELKCFEEAGDVNTLMDYYEAAEENTDEKKKGIIRTIWDKIVAFINKILGRTAKKNDDEDYYVDSKLKKKVEAFKNAANSVIQFITNPIKSIFTKGVSLWKKLIGILEAITIGTVAIVGGKAVITGIAKAVSKGKENNGNSGEAGTVEKVSGKELNGFTKAVSDVINKVKNLLNSGKGDAINKAVGDDNEGIVGKIVSSITKAGNDIIGAIKSAPSAVANAAKGAVDTVADKAKNLVDKSKNKAEDKMNEAEGDSEQTESADDFVMTKDFADILAAEPYEEAADTSEVEELLSGLI